MVILTNKHLGLSACVFLEFLILSALNFKECYGYTSVFRLTRLHMAETKLVSAMQAFLHREKAVTDEIREYITRVERMHKSSCVDENYSENPINAFHLLRRFVDDWGGILKHLDSDDNMAVSSESVKDLNSTITEILEDVGLFPSTDDVIGAAFSILRLWNFYKLNLTNLLNGRILETQTDPLTDEDVFFIARQAENREMFYEVISWLEELLKRISQSQVGDGTITQSIVARSLASAYHKIGMPWKSLEIISNQDIQKDAKLLRDYKYYSSLVTKPPGTSISSVLQNVLDKNEKQYRALCRGNQKKSKQLAKLHCYHRPTSIPYLRGKEEVVHNSPRISLFHDVISDRESKIIQSLSEKLFVRSTVALKTNYNAVMDNVRVSETAWIKDDSYPDIPDIGRLTWRVGIITGLNTKYRSHLSDVEQFQVLNYGIGGMYYPHIDLLRYPLWGPPNENESFEIRGTGERIATWMFYLTNVKAGGATVFPKIKARVPAVKGAAAFWYNLLPSGDPDERTLHAGCPVLLGSKWVCNKWIREGGQVFSHLCGKSPTSQLFG